MRLTDDTHPGSASGLTCSVRPLYDRLLVKVIPEGERTAAGLVIPELAIENTPYRRAIVIASGHGRPTMSGEVAPLQVKDGDVVAFVRTSGTRDEQIVWPMPDGSEALVIREQHVVLVFSDLPKTSGVLGADGREVVS